MKVTLTKTSFADNKNYVTRQTLVRNVMDFLEFEIGWDDAEYITDIATKEELLQIIIAYQNDDDETKNAIIEKYLSEVE